MLARAADAGLLPPATRRLRPPRRLPAGPRPSVHAVSHACLRLRQLTCLLCGLNSPCLLAGMPYVPNTGGAPSAGTGSPGFWLNNGLCQWPTDTVKVGNVTYTKAQAVRILDLATGSLPNEVGREVRGGSVWRFARSATWSGARPDPSLLQA